MKETVRTVLNIDLVDMTGVSSITDTEVGPENTDDETHVIRHENDLGLGPGQEILVFVADVKDTMSETVEPRHGQLPNIKNIWNVNRPITIIIRIDIEVGHVTVTEFILMKIVNHKNCFVNKTHCSD